MVREIEDVTSFTNAIETKYDPNFTVEIAGTWKKLLADSFCKKEKLSDYLKEHKYQFYVVPSIEVSMKFVMRGFLKNIQAYNIRTAIDAAGYEIYRANQIRIRKDV